MKITKNTLKQLIKEEIKSISLSEVRGTLRTPGQAAGPQTARDWLQDPKGEWYNPKTGKYIYKSGSYRREGGPPLKMDPARPYRKVPDAPGLQPMKVDPRSSIEVFDDAARMRSAEAKIDASNARRIRKAAAARAAEAETAAATAAGGRPGAMGAAMAAELSVHAIDSMVGPELRKLIASFTGTDPSDIPMPTLKQRLKSLASPVTGLIDLAGMGVDKVSLALGLRGATAQEKGEKEFKRRVSDVEAAKRMAQRAGFKPSRTQSTGAVVARANENKITKKQLTQIILEELETVLGEQALEEGTVQDLERSLATAEKRLKAAIKRGDAKARLKRFRQAVKNIKNRLRIAKQKK